jgi:hypothetical protein
MAAQSRFVEIFEWRGDVALGCARSIFRNNTAAHGPAFRSQLIPITKRTVVICAMAASEAGGRSSGRAPASWPSLASNSPRAPVPFFPDAP